MATHTPSLNLSKPTVNGPETANAWGVDLNDNFDKIDAWVGELPDRVTDIEDTQIPEAPADGRDYVRRGSIKDWLPLGLGLLLADGDKGDIVTSNNGGTWLFDPTVVTAAARTVLDDATIPAMRTTLGAAALVHTHVVADVTGLQAALDAQTARDAAQDTVIAGKASAVHTHAIVDVTGLQPALDAKAPLVSPALTGTPTAPTAPAATNTTQLATTAFVAQAVSVVAAGTVLEAPNDGKTYGRKSLGWSVLDITPDWSELTNVPATFPPSAHTHVMANITDLAPALALKAPLASPVFTGDPQAPTPATADNDTSIATTAFVKAQGYATATYADAGDALRVLKAGDTMTGALTVDMASLAALNLNTPVGANGGIVRFRKNNVNDWAIFDASDRSLNFNRYDSTGNNLETAISLGGGATLGTGTIAFDGAITSTGQIKVTKAATASFVSQNSGVFNGFQVTNSAGPITGSLSAHTDSNVYINNAGPAGAGVILSVSGTPILKAPLSGVYISPTGGTYGLDVRGVGSPGAGVIGWGPGNAAYGMCGANQGAVNYSFYGSTSAYIAGGNWGVSDGTLKAVTGTLDPKAALNAVNAITVKQYQAISPAAREYIYGTPGDEPLYGWIAQEVELLIPIAVRDVGIPKDDIRSRAMMRGIAMPKGEAAEALGEEDMTVKAINDRYMLTTLWAAVQALSARVAELEGAA